MVVVTRLTNVSSKSTRLRMICLHFERRHPNAADQSGRQQRAERVRKISPQTGDEEQQIAEQEDWSATPDHSQRVGEEA